MIGVLNKVIMCSLWGRIYISVLCKHVVKVSIHSIRCIYIYIYMYVFMYDHVYDVYKFSFTADHDRCVCWCMMNKQKHFHTALSCKQPIYPFDDCEWVWNQHRADTSRQQTAHSSQHTHPQRSSFLFISLDVNVNVDANPSPSPSPSVSSMARSDSVVRVCRFILCCCYCCRRCHLQRSAIRCNTNVNQVKKFTHVRIN